MSQPSDRADFEEVASGAAYGRHLSNRWTRRLRLSLTGSPRAGRDVVLERALDIEVEAREDLLALRDARPALT